MALLTGMTPDGQEVPVQVDTSGRLVAEGLPGPRGEQGPKGDQGGPGQLGGTAAAPSITPPNDPATGFYSPGSGQVAISTNSTGRLFVDSSGRVGIGSSAPLARTVISNDANENLEINTGIVSVNGGIIRYVNRGATPTDRPDLSFYLPSNGGAHKFYTSDTERARIDSSGRLLVGTSSAFSNRLVQIEGTSSATTNLSIIRHEANANAPVLDFYKSRGTTNGSRDLVADGDGTGSIIFAGADGTTHCINARIEAFIDGTPGANDMPGRLVFSTTADGASSPTERMRIKNNGTINFSNVAVYADNAAATTGGLAVGDVYRTSTGQLMIRY